MFFEKKIKNFFFQVPNFWSASQLAEMSTLLSITAPHGVHVSKAGGHTTIPKKLLLLHRIGFLTLLVTNLRQSLCQLFLSMAAPSSESGDSSNKGEFRDEDVESERRSRIISSKLYFDVPDSKVKPDANYVLLQLKSPISCLAWRNNFLLLISLVCVRFLWCTHLRIISHFSALKNCKNTTALSFSSNIITS